MSSKVNNLDLCSSTARARGASIDATARLLQAEATTDAEHVLPGG